MNPVIVANYVLPAFGIALIGLAIACFFVPQWQKLTEKIQKIKAFGIDMEVSALTLVILLGVAMSSTGVALHILDYERRAQQMEKDLQAAKAEILAIQLQLDNARKTQVKLLVKPEGATQTEMANLLDWKCEYHIVGEPDVKRADISRGYGLDQFGITLNDVNKSTIVASLQLLHVPSNKNWLYSQMFSPLEPTFTVKKKEP